MSLGLGQVSCLFLSGSWVSKVKNKTKRKQKTTLLTWLFLRLLLNSDFFFFFLAKITEILLSELERWLRSSLLCCAAPTAAHYWNTCTEQEPIISQDSSDFDISLYICMYFFFLLDVMYPWCWSLCLLFRGPRMETIWEMPSLCVWGVGVELCIGLPAQ